MARCKESKYTGEALKTFERIHVLRMYTPNKLYISPEGVMYFINKHGFMHCFTIGRCKGIDGKPLFCIYDNLLTSENLLHETFTNYYRTKEEARAAWAEMKADAETNTAQLIAC